MEASITAKPDMAKYSLCSAIGSSKGTTEVTGRIAANHKAMPNFAVFEQYFTRTVAPVIRIAGPANARHHDGAASGSRLWNIGRIESPRYRACVQRLVKA